MILVVGGAGYIGSHMCRLLRDSGIPHVALDSLENGHRAAISGTELVVGDIRDRAAITAVLNRFSIDLVMHFAAYIEVGQSVREPARYWQNNVIGVWNLLEEMREHGVRQFVFSSTAAVYGEPEQTPIDELHPTRPTSPYGETKLAVERMLKSYERAYGVRSVCLRYFNASGAHPDGAIGEDHEPETHLIPLIIRTAMGLVPSLKLFGTDYPTPDGTCIRDYVHVVDLVDAHQLAVDHLRSGGGSAVFNLGNGQGFSVREVVRAVEHVTGHSVRLVEEARREGDPAVLVASSDAIKKHLDWSPKYPELETIVRHAWKWHRDHPNGYNDRA